MVAQSTPAMEEERSDLHTEEEKEREWVSHDMRPEAHRVVLPVVRSSEEYVVEPEGGVHQRYLYPALTWST